MIKLPSLNAQLVDAMRRMVAPWNSFFQQFTQTPAPAMTVSVGSSPFFYTALEPGTLVLQGGTITNLQLIRGSLVINIINAITIPLGIDDVVIITYSVLPNAYFFPSLGVAPQ